MRLALVIALAAACPATAQDGPRGIAFAQAPEQSFGVGTGANAREAIEAAVDRCVDGGAAPRDCIVTNYCSPAGWSVDLFVQHREGLHWHEVTCGLPDRRIAEGIEKLACDRGIRPWLIECTLVQIYDPDGKPMIRW